jgi:DNA N-6-adenine-methyltransferase (Dam)
MKTALKSMFSRASWEWKTPRRLFEELDKEFSFDFDPCPLGGDVARRATLFVSWKNKWVFCNPPYGPEIPKFLSRATEAALAVFLLPARTDTRWFHDHVLSRAQEIRFIKGRLRFGDEKNSAPFPSMVVVFSKSVPCAFCPSCNRNLYIPMSDHLLNCESSGGRT